MRITKLPEEFLASKKNEIRKITLEKGTVTCEMGNPCEFLPVVVEGCVRVYRPAKDGRMITLYRVVPNESCVMTIACILNGTQFPCIAEVEEQVTAYLIPANKVMTWQAQSVWQAFIFSQLSLRLGSLVELTDDLAFHKMDARVARLLKQREKSGIILATHQQLANEIGTSREVVSRTLKHMEVQHLVTLHRNQVQIKDFDMLSQLAA